MRFRFVVLGFLLAASCASPPRPTPPPPRMPDSAPEKRAAQRHAVGGPNLNLEAEEKQFGIEEAKERKLQQEEAKIAPPKVVIPMPRMATDGGVGRDK